METKYEEKNLDLEYYVLRYDIVTTKYNNEIVFQTYNQALNKYESTIPTPGELVELIFSPLNGGDNVIVKRKNN